MKYKIVITIMLFIFSFLYLKNAIYFIQQNDKLMQSIKEKQIKYQKEPIDAIITKNTMIPGKNGKKINLDKSYKKMKVINSFQESLIVYDEILPNKSIKNNFNKVIISGNLKSNKISVLTSLNDEFCYTEDLTIQNECIKNKKYTILIHKITTNHLTKIKELVKNGIIFYLPFNDDNDDLNLIIKYLKNNNYNIVSINELIEE